MSRPVTCRHCGESFIPEPGKPGFINECPACLETKSHTPTVRTKMEQVLAARGWSRDQIDAEVFRVRKRKREFGKKRGWSEDRIQRYINQFEATYEWIEF